VVNTDGKAKALKKVVGAGGEIEVTEVSNCGWRPMRELE